MKNAIIIFLLASAVFLVSCVNDEDDRVYIDRNSWTFMMYMDADNNLEGPILEDLREMQKGIRDRIGISVIALVDRHPQYSTDDVTFGEDFEDTRLYKINSDSYERLEGMEYFPEIGKELSFEANMGDAHTLKNFINFCKKYHKADYYALILANHGNGPRGLGGRAAGRSRALCEDESSQGDMLYIGEISDVLTEDESVDFIGFDACFMGSAEVAYQFSGGGFSARYMAASPPEENVYGWAYDRIFSRISYKDSESGEVSPVSGKDRSVISAQSLTPEELCRIIVEEHFESTEGIAYECLACYDLEKASYVREAVDGFSSAIALSPHAADIKTVLEHFRDDEDSSWSVFRYFNSYETYERIYYPFYDLYAMADYMCQASPDSGIGLMAREIKTAVSVMVLYSFGNYYEGFRNGEHGLSVFFPEGDAIINSAEFGSRRAWAYQWWYNPLYTAGISTENQAVSIDGWLYGNLKWCAGGTEGDGIVQNWFELLDSWYDDPSLEGVGGHNLYNY